MPGDEAFAKQGLVPLPPDGHAQLAGQRVHHVKAHVMAGVGVLGAGVSQTDEQLRSLQAAFRRMAEKNAATTSALEEVEEELEERESESEDQWR